MSTSLNEWKNYDQFLSASSTQRYLKGCYLKLDGSLSVDELSYRNCYSFIYYLTHGKRHFDLCRNSPLELQPVLLYYGMIQLIKCCLLTVDPYYPESTALLAHGVTTRKRKKQNYLFLHDEIKVQRNGLFPYFSEQLFGMKQLDGDKFQMKELFSQLPDMDDLFRQIHGNSPLLEVKFNTDHQTLSIPNHILDQLHMTESRFMQFVRHEWGLNHLDIKSVDSSFILKSDEKALIHLPWLKKSLESKWYIPSTREGYDPLHEIMVFYLLLYNLSMISRYETEWWGELFHTYSSNDFPFISRFLSIAQHKVPMLLMQFLNEKRGSFR